MLTFFWLDVNEKLEFCLLWHSTLCLQSLEVKAEYIIFF